MTKRASLTLKLSLVAVALVATFGLVFGLASIKHGNQYINFDKPTGKISYASTPTKSSQYEGITPFTCPIGSTERKTYGEQILDGSNHQVIDKSFNQSAYKGLVNWLERTDWTPDDADTTKFPSEQELLTYPANWGKPDNDQPTGFVSRYSAAVTGGARSIILPGYLHETPLEQFLSQSASTAEKSGYILIDSQFNHSNVASIMFRADQSAFLAGLSICQYLSIDNFDHYIKKGDLKVGTFGGNNIPTVTIYMGGFERGVEFFNNKILPILKVNNGWDEQTANKHLVHFMSLGKMDSFFSGTFTIGDGRSIVQNLLANGADAIMPVAGPQTIDTVQEIANQKSDCVVIGVDTDQENSDMNVDGVFTDSNNNKKIIKFSAEKNIAYLTSAVLYLAEKGKDHFPDSAPFDPDSSIGSYGYLTIGNLSNNGCKVSDNGKPYIVELLNEFYSKTFTSYDLAMKDFVDDSTNKPLEFIDSNMEFEY